MRLRTSLVLLVALALADLAHAQRTGGSFGASAWGARPTPAPPRATTPAPVRTPTPPPPRSGAPPAGRSTVGPVVRPRVVVPVVRPVVVRPPSARTEPVRMDHVAPRRPDASEPLDPVDCAVGRVGARHGTPARALFAMLFVLVLVRRGRP